jgi:uncharacterized protein (DUF924 family)
MSDSEAPQRVLDFWFGTPGSAEAGTARDVWFKKTSTFDQECRDRFEALHRAAAAGALDDWTGTPHNALALVILLDQFSRNIYRDTAQAFACDAKALEVAREAIARGFDRELTPLERMFLYLPFEHSEDLADQDRSVELFSSLQRFPETQTTPEYAQAHRAVIQRFGRFPHRNAILSRPSTPEEERYLAEGGARW